MAITVTVTPGKQFAATERITTAKLNQLGQPTFAVTGTVQTADIADASLTPVKLAPGAYLYTSSVSFSDPTYTLTGYPATPVLANGLELWFKASADNVATVSIDATGVAKKLFKTKTEILVKGDIRANQIVGMRYETSGDSGAGAWQMISQLGTAPVYYDSAPTGTGDAVVLAIGPAPAAYADLAGKIVSFKATGANTGACTVKVNALAAPPTVKKSLTLDLVANDIKIGQIVQLLFDGTNWQFQGQNGNAALVSGSEITVMGITRGLKIVNNAAAGKLDLSADEVVVKTAAGISNLQSAVGFTIDISGAAVGANGYDVGWAAAAWYYVWVIFNPTGPTVAGLLSLSNTTPTLPTGYTFRALVGTVRALTATTLSAMLQWGREVGVADANIFTAKTLTLSYAALAGVDLTAFQAAIPPMAKTVSGTMGASGSNNALISVGADATGLGNQTACVGATASTINGFSAGAPFRLVLGTNNIFVVSSDAVTARNRLNVSGYSI